MAVWISIVAIALSELFAHDLFVNPNPSAQWLLTSIAVSVMAFKLRHAGAGRPRTGTIIVLTITAGVLLALSRGCDRPAYWTALGFGIIALMSGPLGRHPAMNGVVLSGFFSAFLSAVSGPVYFLYTSFTARNPTIDSLADPIAACLRFVGFRASAVDGSIMVETLKDTFRVVVGFNHLAAYPALLILVVGAIALMSTRSSGRFGSRLAVLMIVSIAYVLLRFIAILGVFTTRMMMVPFDSDRVAVEVFWLPTITALSFAPLALVLGLLAPIDPARWINRMASRDNGLSNSPIFRWRGTVFAALAGIALVIGLRFQDPGTEKPGRVLIDESKSKWERSDRPSTVDWYGSESGYNYYGIAEYLDRYYTVDRNLDQAITAQSLESVDVLVLKTPTDRYSESEIDAIVDFVQRGGGLFILGEHSNVWGSTSFLNPIARRFGFRFRYDCVFDIERKWEEVWFPSRGIHAATAHVPFFQFAVSSSIESSDWRVDPVLRGEGLWTLPIDYKADNFYPQVIDDTAATWGVFDQAVAVEKGAGRVVGFADSTVFSNFDAFHPGRIDFLLDTVAWLNRTNRFEWVSFVGWGLFLLFGSAFAIDLARRPRLFDEDLLVVFLTTLVVTAASSANDRWTRSNHEPRESRKEVVHLVFDMDNGAYELPIFGFSTDFFNCYDVFHQWVLRVGAFPKPVFDASSSYASNDPIVLLRPTKSLDAEKRCRVMKFVEDGGALIILDQPDRVGTAHEWLAPFGIEFSNTIVKDGDLFEPQTGASFGASVGGNSYRPGAGSMTVTGVKPLVVGAHGEVVLGAKRIGKGILIVGGIAELFADPSMGGSHGQIPNMEVRRRFELAFTLMRAAIHRDPVGEFVRAGTAMTAP